MLLVAALPPVVPKVSVSATASVRIERPVAVTDRHWRSDAAAQHREVVVRDEHGRTILLRLIENQ